MEEKVSENKVRYFCRSCNYKFFRGKNLGFPRTCPYCDKDSVEVLKVKSAEDLVKESEKHGSGF